MRTSFLAAMLIAILLTFGCTSIDKPNEIPEVIPANSIDKPNETCEVIPAEEAVKKAMDYINDYMLQTKTASVVSIDEAESGLYHFRIVISGKEYDSYVTLDGKLLFPISATGIDEPESGLYHFKFAISEKYYDFYVTPDGKLLFPISATDLDEIPNPQPAQQQQPSAPDVPKAERPEAHAFVMSYCPYGLQFMKAYVPVIELLGDKADLEVNFVQYTMHGKKEIDENTRMYCIQKEQKEKFTDYLRCFVEGGDYECCLDTVGIDKAKLDDCIASADEEFQITKASEESSERYPPYPVDVELAQQYGVKGSPDFVVNGHVIKVNRSPEAVKEAICTAFEEPPAECSQILSTAAEASGLGPIGSPPIGGSTASSS